MAYKLATGIAIEGNIPGVRWVTVAWTWLIHSASLPGLPMSSALGTNKLAPKKRGVKTGELAH